MSVSECVSVFVCESLCVFFCEVFVCVFVSVSPYVPTVSGAVLWSLGYCCHWAALLPW